MAKAQHGGDILSFREAYGVEPLDFSSNVNPFGLSPLAAQAVQNALHTAHHYPDPHCRRLRAALSQHEGVPVEQILCGNGAADLIFRLVLALHPKKALLLAPSFLEYEQALGLVDCQIQRHYLKREEGFTLTEEILPAITADIDLLVLCEPNNPTGRLCPPELLKRILLRCRETGTTLLADECFSGFLDDPAAHSLKPYLTDTPGLFLLKAFTKLYGMAGLRLGYLLSTNTATLEKTARCGQPWPVSSLAQAAGEAALQDAAYLTSSLPEIRRQRGLMAAGLSNLGLCVLPGGANYLFFSSGETRLQALLAQKGILIRSCAAYPGLSPGDYRVAIRQSEENQKLLLALDEVLATAKISPRLWPKAAPALPRVSAGFST